MGESAKATCQLLVIACGIGAIIAWAMWYPRQDPWIWWSVRISLPAIAALAAWPLIRDGLANDLVPDHLHPIVGNACFRREGFVFSPLPGFRDGYLEWRIFFQNTWERGCDAFILMRLAPERRSFQLSRIDESMTLRIPIQCDSGAFGVATVYQAVPRKYWGQNVAFEIYADVRYPNGRGRRLRKSFAGQVGKATVDWGQIAYGTLIVAGAVAGAVVLGGAPAMLHVKLHDQYCEDAPQLPTLTQETLWRPDPSVLPPLSPGFPISPSTASADSLVAHR